MLTLPLPPHVGARLLLQVQARLKMLGGPGSGRYPKGSGDETSLKHSIFNLRGQLAEVAQKVYDEWQPGSEGDPEIGFGGICDRIADALGFKINSELLDVDTVAGTQEGDEHANIIVHDGSEAYRVDISQHKYESGSGYDYEKIDGVTFTADDIEISPVDINDVEPSDYWQEIKKNRSLGGPGSGRYPKGSGGNVAEPRIFNTPADIEKHEGGWPGDPIRYGWKTHPGMLVTGLPLEKSQLPEILYHVTTNAPAVEATGLLLGQQTDAGMGGGQADGVSFSTNPDDSIVVQRELTRSVKIARGEDTIASLEKYAREDELAAGLPPGTLDGAIEFAHGSYDIGIDAVWDGVVQKDKPGYLESLTKDALNAYLIFRERWAKDHPILKNPILFGRQEKLKLIDPNNVRTLRVPRQNIPDMALITSGSDAFLSEVRVYADVPVAGMKHNEGLETLGGPGSGRYPKGSGGDDDGETVSLYRGDAQAISPSLSYSDPGALFGTGIYLTDNKRIAGDYKAKGAHDGVHFRYGGGSKSTKEEAIDAYKRQLATFIDEHGKETFYQVSLPSMADDPIRLARLKQGEKAWERMSKSVEVRKMADNTIIIRDKTKTGSLSEYAIPKTWISKTLDAEDEISKDVIGVLQSASNSRGAAREIEASARPEEDWVGVRPSYRQVYTANSEYFQDEEAQLTLRRGLKELGYKGIQYNGGQTMGGAKHTAYVFWDEQGLKKARQLSDYLWRVCGGPGSGRYPKGSGEGVGSFKEWFGNSKVVDVKGNPLVVYHGTDADIEQFKINERGIFFSASPKVASNYASFGEGKGGNVVPVYLSFKNPLIVVDPDPGRRIGANYYDVRQGELMEKALTGGHDGIIVRAIRGRKDESLYVAFRPEQVKSATGNRMFDPNNPLITLGGPGSGRYPKGSGGQTSTPEFKAWFKDSAVVNADGTPKVMYHGTNSDPKDFHSGSHFGTVNAANERANILEQFSTGVVHRDPGQFQVMPVYLSIQNPLRLPDLVDIDGQTGQLMTEARAAWEEKYPDEDERLHRDEEHGEGPRARAWENEGDLMEVLRERDIVSTDEFWDHQYAKDREIFALLAKKGYDGIVYNNSVEDAGNDSWIIFHPNQVKSAIGNTGAFSRKTKLITGELATLGGPGSGRYPKGSGGDTQASARRGSDVQTAAELADPVFQDMLAYTATQAQDPDASEFEKTHSVVMARAYRESMRPYQEINSVGSDAHYSTEDGSYTVERQALHNKIVDHYISEFFAPQDHPQAIVTGGLPGAGKSTGLRETAGDTSSYVTVNSDDIKEMLPEYKDGTGAAWLHFESDYIARDVLRHAVAARQNIILDVTMKSIGLSKVPTLEDGLGGRIKALNEAGYRTIGVFTEIDVKESAQRAMTRYVAEGRFVPPDYIRSARTNTRLKTQNRETFERVKELFKNGNSSIDWKQFKSGAPATTVDGVRASKPTFVAEGKNS